VAEHIALKRKTRNKSLMEKDAPKSIAELSRFESVVYLYCWEPRTITEMLEMLYPETRQPNRHLLLKARQKLEEHGFIKKTSYSLRNTRFAAVKERAIDYFIGACAKRKEIALDANEQHFFRLYFLSQAAARVMDVLFYERYKSPMFDKIKAEETAAYGVPNYKQPLFEKTEHLVRMKEKQLRKNIEQREACQQMIWAVFSHVFAAPLHREFYAKHTDAFPNAKFLSEEKDFDIFLQVWIASKTPKLKADALHFVDRMVRITGFPEYYIILTEDLQFLGIPSSVAAKLGAAMGYTSSCMAVQL
jgi:hypothetical protein